LGFGERVALPLRKARSCDKRVLVGGSDRQRGRGGILLLFHLSTLDYSE